MRITGGDFRGRKISCPRGKRVRPTTDRVREALFDILSANFVRDWSAIGVMDLFAGTGALGLEALSRGAKSCIFIEKDRSTLQFLKKNLALLDEDEIRRLKVVLSDVYPFLESGFSFQRDFFPVEIVFADPPYGKGHMERSLRALSENKAILDRNGLLVVEEDKRAGFIDVEPYGFEILMIRTYGDTALFFMKRNNND